jgi:5-methylcytosine-specific restriction protein A
MPTQPPRFAFVKRAPRQAWVRPTKYTDTRLRGRAGQRERARILAEEPTCRRCDEVDIVTPSEEVDHIVPLSLGGTEARANKQALCKPCHKAKTAIEAAAARRAAAG